MTAKQRIIDSMLESQISVSEALADRNEKIADILSEHYGISMLIRGDSLICLNKIRAELSDYMDEQVTDGEVEDKEKLDREQYNRDVMGDR